jgi:hypothetical protein
MSPATQRYCNLLSALLNERELSGGELPDEQEERYAADLDACWNRLNAQEVEEVERYFAHPPRGAAQKLEDRKVEEGERVLPRLEVKTAA